MSGRGYIRKEDPVNNMKFSSPDSPSRQLNLLRLSDLACQDPGLVGSKSATLALLYHILPGAVPPGVALSPPQTEFFAGLSGRDGLAKASQALLGALGEHGTTMGKRYAVRSSALDEDSASYSFAGQYETALGLSSVDDIITAIGACAHSADLARIAAYRSASMQESTSAVGVLIQEMVPADRAGVAFTINPLTGADEIVINASFGLGDLLVSGQITPDEFIIDTSSQVSQFQVSKLTVGSKRLMSVSTSHGIIHTPVPKSLQVIPSLSDGQLNEIISAARACESALGHPVDLEWAMNGNMLFILQARPVTAILTAGVRHD
jgi:phosphoenolpyruvate synthase/pyruvate phosphate dikinase